MTKIYFTALLSLLLLDACSGTSKSVYDDYFTSGEFPSGNAIQGEQLFAGSTVGANNSPGCVPCHAVESDVAIIGPSQVGLATLAQEALDDPAYEGQTTTVEGYLWESVVDSKAYLRPEYADVMYKAYGETLTQQEIADLVAYMMTLE